MCANGDLRFRHDRWIAQGVKSKREVKPFVDDPNREVHRGLRVRMIQVKPGPFETVERQSSIGEVVGDVCLNHLRALESGKPQHTETWIGPVEREQCIDHRAEHFLPWLVGALGVNSFDNRGDRRNGAIHYCIEDRLTVGKEVVEPADRYLRPSGNHPGGDCVGPHLIDERRRGIENRTYSGTTSLLGWDAPRQCCLERPNIGGGRLIDILKPESDSV